MKALAAALILLALTGCTASSDGPACAMYETAYNTAEDAVAEWQAGTATREAVDAAVGLRVDRISQALDLAGDGTVKDAIAVSYGYAAASRDDPANDDVGVAFYLQAVDVADACSDAGRPISLH